MRLTGKVCLNRLTAGRCFWMKSAPCRLSFRASCCGGSQEDYVRRVGGTKDIPIDVRIIATINERAEGLIQSGKLRKDLYYRLNIISIELLAAERKKDDILL